MMDGTAFALHALEFADGTLADRGFEHLESFILDGSIPTWTYALEDALLERTVWMERDRNTTYVRYRHARGTRALDLSVGALVTDRDFHVLLRAGEPPAVELLPDGAAVRWGVGETRLIVRAANAAFTPDGAWWLGFRHREEAARGLDDTADVWSIGSHRVLLEPGASWTLVLSAEDGSADGSEGALPDGETALAAARARDTGLLLDARAERSSPLVRQLVLAADAFIVRRPEAGAAAPVSDAGRSIVAGYPWFNDWGRDTMIALPGLTLATGRPRDAAAILRSFGRWVADGLLPNDFPSRAGATPEYNTVDAALWYVQAIRAYHEATRDDALLDVLLPVVRTIVDAHVEGTRHGIGVDERDGLLAAGEPGVQLTWMDALVDGWVVTPRMGKPVEINALWYNALCTVGPWLIDRGDAAAGRACMAMAERVARTFRARFWRPDLGHLADVVDGPDGDDVSLRPNQVFALSLPFPLLNGPAARSTLEAVGRALLTTYGLRTLDPHDRAYRGTYAGDRVARDGAYHQGSAWAWLIGAYAEAVERVTGDREAAQSVLRPFAAHLADAGLGSISELFDGDAPHPPRGCPWQAWSVAEVLRAWRLLGGE